MFEILELNVVGSVIVTFALCIHPFESNTETEYAPAHKPVAVIVVCEEASLHRYVYGVVPPIALTVAVPLQLP